MASKENIYSSIQNLYNMDKTTWQEVLAEFYNLIYDTQLKFEQVETKFTLLLGEEVTKQIKEMYEDGLLGELINETLLKDINNKVDNFKNEINEQLEHNTKKNINILTPELYGAIGNGENDDTEAIQEMFNNAKCGQKIKFKSNTKYLISKTIKVPKNVEVDGCGCFIMIDDSMVGLYAFKLGVIMNNNTLDTMMVQNEFKNFNIQHYGKPDGKYYHGINVIQQCKITNIYTWGLDRTICVDSNYIDVVTIDGINIWGKWGDNYAIDTGFLGDCRKVTNVHFLHETSSFNLLKIGDGHNTCRVEGIINGNIYVGKSMCELSNIHTEFGNITFNGSNATLKNLFILVPSDRASIVINDYSNISLENCMFNYYEGREYTPSSNYYDIEFEDVSLSNLSVKNCFKNMLPSSDIKFRVTNGINIKNCNDFNNNALGNSISSIVKANRVISSIQPYLRSNNSNDYIKAIYEDSNFKWNKASGTYYYKCCLVYDETRKIGDTNKSNELSKELTLNSGSSLIHMNGVPTSNIKLYRGTTSNSYSECVTLAPFTNKIYDRGTYANGCIWENRTSGVIDTYFKVYMYEKHQNGNVTVQATTTPTVGVWKDGDRIIQAVPKPGAIKGWIYNGTSWISEGTY